MRVHAELRLDVDGTPARLTGAGGDLVLETDSPAALWSALSAAALPDAVGSVAGVRAIGRLADGLRDAGLTLDVRGPSGSAGRLGAGVDSRAGRLLTGSQAVAPGAPGALGPLVGSRVLEDRRAAAVGTLGAVGVAGVVAAVVLLRRRRR